MVELRRISRARVFLLVLSASVGITLLWPYVLERWITDKFGSTDKLATCERTQPAIRNIARDRKHWWCSGRFDPTNGMNSHFKPHSTSKLTEKYFLTAVLVVRIFASDTNHLTTRELVQWLQYLSYAGVEHVYIYDSFLYKNESQKENLRCFIENGYVTYVDWSYKAVPNPMSRDGATQVPAYNDCWQQFGQDYVWQLVMDIDEYPYSSKDHQQGFLSRVIQKLLQNNTGGKPIVQITLQNYLFLGKPINGTQYPLLIERFGRRSRKPLLGHSHRTKHIYLSKAVAGVQAHNAYPRKGFIKVDPDAALLRMNHYHGDRHKELNGPKLMNMTQVDLGMKTAASALQKCQEQCSLGCC